jgi:hypothetical protein
MVHPEISAIGSEFFGGNRQIDGLQQRVSGRTGSRLRRRRPVTK